MEVLVLLGGFAAIFVCGYVLMSKLDDWLAAPQNKEEHPGAGTHVRVLPCHLYSTATSHCSLSLLIF